MARLAREREDRDHAAAELRRLRSLVAALALVKGGNAGRIHFGDVERELITAANAGLANEPPPALTEERKPRRARRKP